MAKIAKNFRNRQPKADISLYRYGPETVSASVLSLSSARRAGGGSSPGPCLRRTAFPKRVVRAGKNRRSCRGVRLRACFPRVARLPPASSRDLSVRAENARFIAFSRLWSCPLSPVATGPASFRFFPFGSLPGFPCRRGLWRSF